YMPQEVVLQSHKSVYDEAFSAFDDFQSLMQQKTAYEEAFAQEQDIDEKSLENYVAIQERLNHYNHIELDRFTKEVLTGLGFDDEKKQVLVNTLSVGWKMRVVLAKLLLQRADFYLFDEPTNHLDIVAQEWFFTFLNQAHFGFLLVSH